MSIYLGNIRLTAAPYTDDLQYYGVEANPIVWKYDSLIIDLNRPNRITEGILYKISENALVAYDTIDTTTVFGTDLPRVANKGYVLFYGENLISDLGAEKNYVWVDEDSIYFGETCSGSEEQMIWVHTQYGGGYVKGIKYTNDGGNTWSEVSLPLFYRAFDENELYIKEINYNRAVNGFKTLIFIVDQVSFMIPSGFTDGGKNNYLYRTVFTYLYNFSNMPENFTGYFVKVPWGSSYGQFYVNDDNVCVFKDAYGSTYKDSSGNFVPYMRYRNGEPTGVPQNIVKIENLQLQVDDLYEVKEDKKAVEVIKSKVEPGIVANPQLIDYTINGRTLTITGGIAWVPGSELQGYDDHQHDIPLDRQGGMSVTIPDGDNGKYFLWDNTSGEYEDWKWDTFSYEDTMIPDGDTCDRWTSSVFHLYDYVDSETGDVIYATHAYGASSGDRLFKVVELDSGYQCVVALGRAMNNDGVSYYSYYDMDRVEHTGSWSRGTNTFEKYGEGKTTLLSSKYMTNSEYDDPRTGIQFMFPSGNGGGGGGTEFADLYWDGSKFVDQRSVIITGNRITICPGVRVMMANGMNRNDQAQFVDYTVEKCIVDYVPLDLPDGDYNIIFRADEKILWSNDIDTDLVTNIFYVDGEPTVGCSIGKCHIENAIMTSWLIDTPFRFATLEKLDKKVDKTSEPSRIYGTDEHGNQTTFSATGFGLVDDVEIHGISKVEDKVADLSVVEQVVNLTPSGFPRNEGIIVQYIGENTTDPVSDVEYVNGYFYKCVEKRNTNFTIWTDNEGTLSHFYEPQYYNKETFENYVHPTESTTITLCCKIVSEDPWEVMWYLEDDPNPDNPTEARPSWYGWEYTPDDLDRTTGANDTDQIKFIYTVTTSYEWIRYNTQPETEVVDNVTTQSSTSALSANMGYELQEQITALSGRGRYLATWDMVTGLPTSLPTTPSPYEYKNGDYYVVARAQRAEPESFTVNQTSGTPYDYVNPVMSIYKAKRFTEAGIDPIDEDDIFNYSKIVTRPSEGNQGTEKVAVANQGKFDAVYAQRLAHGQETYGERLISVSDDVRARWFEYGGVLYLQVMANYHYWSDDPEPQEQDSDEGYVSQNYAVSSAWTLDQKKQMVKDWFMAVAGLEITGDMYYGMAPWYEEIHFLEEDTEAVNAFWTLNGEKLPVGEALQDYGIYAGAREQEYGDSIVAHYRTLKVNYKPNGSQFVYDPVPVASTTVETELVNANDTYLYDGTNWILLSNTQKEIVFGMIAGSPYDNTELANALNAKQDTLTAGTNITIEEDTQTGDLVISSTSQESFFRGRWATWTTVPTDTSLYPEDYHGNRVPKNNDYMVIEDASDYVSEPSPTVRVETKSTSAGAAIITVTNIANGQTVDIVHTSASGEIQLFDNDVYVTYSSPYWSIYSKNAPIIINDVIYPVGTKYRWSYSSVVDFIVNTSITNLSGAWRFAYHGEWDTDSKNGWLPEYQLENVLPIATDTEPGITKIYSTTGQNTDGSVTQKLVTDELGKKQDTLTAGTGIDISTDASTGKLVISSTSSESFYRGTFATWTLVPTNPTNYAEDPVHHLKTPTNTDYMIVTDASDYYKPGAEITIQLKGYIGGTGYVLELSGEWSDTLIAYNTPYERVYGNNELIINFDAHDGQWSWRVRFNIPVVLNGTRYDAYDVWTGASGGGTRVFNEIVDQPCEGTWRFGYYGEWDTAGRNGWVAEYKIEDTLPIASDTVAGITKLYADLGENTDGAVDQATVTTELGKKQDTLTEGSGISIDENNVISATFSESYFRGKFSTWDTVPTDYRSYYPDYTGSTKPTRTDYMVVEDPSSYIKPGLPIQIYNEPMSGGTAFARFVFGATDITLNHNEVSQRGAEGIIIGTVGNQLKITYASEVWYLTPLDAPVIVDGVTKPINEIALQWHYERPSQETLYKEINFVGQGGYEGTWRFSYQSDDWDTSGKNGWEPEYQIEDVLPIADDTTSGIMKLYTTTGSNTDGTMNQSSITIELGNKQDLLTNASNAGEGIIIDDVTQEISTNNIVWRKW